MTKLSEINEAFNDRNVSANEYGRLRSSWFIERGLGTETLDDTMRYIETLEDERNDLRKELMNSVPASRYWAVNKDWLEAQAKQGDIANRAAEIIKDLEKKLELAQHEREEAR